MAPAIDGLMLASAFNPVFSVLGSAAAAMLLARKPGPVRLVAGGVVLLAAWAIGDGLALSAVSSASEPSASVTLAVAVVGSMALGYALPAWAGVYVGRRVTFGTGWLSAAVVAATVSGALSAIGSVS